MIRTLMLCSVVAVAALAAPQAHGVIIGFEAESGTPGVVNAETFNTVADASALGGFYITVSADGGGAAAGEMAYSVNLPTDDYDLWTKVLAASDGDDSFFAPVDDAALVSGSNDFQDPPLVEVNDLHNLTNETAYVWMLVNANGSGAGDYNITTGGPFDFVINGREDGLRIDAFAFVSASEGFTGELTGGNDTVATAEEAAQLDAAVAPPSAPEPSTLVLVALGMASLTAVRRRRRQ